VVLSPVRRGYGKTGGAWEEGFGNCNAPYYVEAGLETARDIAAAVAYLRERPEVVLRARAVAAQVRGLHAKRWAGRLPPAARDRADGHSLINLKNGVPLWQDQVAAFLREIGVLPR
jgi:hypothetical protein